MPRLMSVRLWQIGKQHEQGASLRQSLTAIWGMGQPGDRERQMSAGVRCRLERFDAQSGIITGEMTRVRHEDFPSEIHPDGARELGVDVPIGDGVAFCYRERDHRLAFQYNDRILSAGKFLDYLESLYEGALYTIQPILDPGQLERFHAEPLKKVTVKVANPTDVVADEDSMQAAASSFRSLGQAYDAPTITLELSVGTSKSFLSPQTKQMLLGFLRTTSDDLRTARAVAGNGSGGRAKEINLLDALFSHKEVIESPRDLEDNYRSRQNLLRRVLDGQR